MSNSDDVKLFRFTFDAGSYDLRQAVVMATTVAEAREKLRVACENAVYTQQGFVATHLYGWDIKDICERDINSNDGLGITEITGDVAFTYGVDG